MIRIWTACRESVPNFLEYEAKAEEEEAMRMVSTAFHSPSPMRYATSTSFLLPPERYLNSIVAILSVAGVIMYAPAELNLMEITLLELLRCASPPIVHVPDGSLTAVACCQLPDFRLLKSSVQSARAAIAAMHATTQRVNFFIILLAFLISDRKITTNY